jgi:hypothetical protein
MGRDGDKRGEMGGGLGRVLVGVVGWGLSIRQYGKWIVGVRIVEEGIARWS